MKTIRIKFVDFWEHWNPNDNFIINSLKKKYNIEFSNNPEYVFYSHFDKKNKHIDYDECIKIFYTQENICPDFNLCDYGISYENIIYGDRHLQFPIFYVSERYGKMWELMKNKHLLSEFELSRLLSREFCCFVVSNKDGSTIRRKVFTGLCSYKKVNSGGKFLNNIGMPHGVPNKLEFSRKHKFMLCLENSAHPGYITEKLIEGFAAQTVPIYWGAPDVTQLFDKNAFINISDFETINDAIEYIKFVDRNDNLYKQMLLTPALKSGNEDIWERKQNEFDEFLYHIIDQDKENAFRRNRVFWGERYFDLYKKMRDVYCIFFQNAIICFPRKVVHYLRKLKNGGLK